MIMVMMMMMMVVMIIMFSTIEMWKLFVDEGDEQDVVVKWTTCEATQPFLWLHFEASLQGQQEQDLILITLTL